MRRGALGGSVQVPIWVVQADITYMASTIPARTVAAWPLGHHHQLPTQEGPTSEKDMGHCREPDTSSHSPIHDAVEADAAWRQKTVRQPQSGAGYRTGYSISRRKPGVIRRPSGSVSPQSPQSTYFRPTDAKGECPMWPDV